MHGTGHTSVASHGPRVVLDDSHHLLPTTSVGGGAGATRPARGSARRDGSLFARALLRLGVGGDARTKPRVGRPLLDGSLLTKWFGRTLAHPAIWNLRRPTRPLQE